MKTHTLVRACVIVWAHISCCLSVGYVKYDLDLFSSIYDIDVGLAPCLRSFECAHCADCPIISAMAVLALQEYLPELSKDEAVAARGYAGKKGTRRVNYCFVTFESQRAAQIACNESERSIKGHVCPACITALCQSLREHTDNGVLACSSNVSCLAYAAATILVVHRNAS